MTTINPHHFNSVRTSFKITAEADALLEQLADRYNITQKELLLTLMIKHTDLAARDLVSVDPKATFVTKTKVMAQAVLQFLGKKAKELATHRDTILESLIYKGREGLQTEQEEIEAVIPDLKAVSEQLRQIRTANGLGPEHPANTRIDILEIMVDNLTSSLESYLKEGVPISSDDFSDSGASPAPHVAQADVIPANSSYLKVYKSRVPNSSISLEQAVPTQTFINLVKREADKVLLKQKSAHHLWDFGVRASQDIEQDDTMWILTGETLYKASVTCIIADPAGSIGDAIGWVRQYKKPWKNVCVLSQVEKQSSIPAHIRSAMHNKAAEIHRNFFRL
ncbi:hypothetical protein CYPRO_1652 [Cyclonatronum proteinivorum]|uniref:Uncharacterized protein n=1 Tax=Cyclonatronum proteinivorum TaxID=1457365 RepID=A0A345UKA1_9BACT|nr:hypothetical protein [Cyclonatronum proteinivorum]AXJ00903.1 hypothetical protein CYPRO_1652 [Cyclonatronum proteinivorum]